MPGKKVFTKRADTFYIPGSEESQETQSNGTIEETQVNTANAQNVNAVASPLAPAPFEIVEVPIEDILDGDYQTRDTERVGMSQEKFERLVISMKKQKPEEPLLVRPHPVEQGKWQLVRGGHSRRDAAKVAEYTHYLVRIVQHDNLQSALGSAWENLARQDLTILEEGELYRRIRTDFGYTQEQLARELGVSRDRIKDCEALQNYSRSIHEMLQSIKRLGGNPERGLRAAKILHRLESLNSDVPGRAEKLIPPLADAFAAEQITTDELEYAVKRVLAAADPLVELTSILQSIRKKGEGNEGDSFSAAQNKKRETPPPDIQRVNNLQLATKRFRSYLNLVGSTPPSDDERRALLQMRQDIDRLLI